MAWAPRLYGPGGRTRESHWASRQAAYRRWYNLTAWRGVNGIRQQVLKRDVLCQECKREGRTAEATQVDHRTPHRGNWSLFVSLENCEGLCESCHSRKTVEENGGIQQCE
jgi:5-methylcytosine-specific restriction protein A